MSAPTQKRTCLFCDSTDLTLEHAWTKRVVKLFDGKDRTVCISVPEDNYLHMYRNNDLTAARVVCGECNGGWMSDLGEAAHPFLERMVRGQPTRIHGESAAILAAWALKTAMVMEHCGMPRKPYFTAAERHAFRDPGIIVDGIAVWIGKAVPTKQELQFICPEKPATPGAKTHRVCMVIGQLAFDIVAMRSLTEHECKFGSPYHSDDRLWIWPWLDYVPSMEWPPKNLRLGPEHFVFLERKLNTPQAYRTFTTAEPPSSAGGLPDQ